MDAERLTLHGDPVAFAASVRARVPAPESVALAVGEIIDQVRETGDGAVIDFTERFDGAQIETLLVDQAELGRAEVALDPAVRKGLERAIGNVRRVGEAAVESDRTVEFDTHSVTVRSAPVQRAAVYVPGGRAPYPSTVVMGVVTARVAGVAEISVCSPPPIDRATLAACALTGVERVYQMGGAQAIAALAFGTESVTPVDVIVGPGNLYVQEAKQQVAAEVGIDGFAGPSDLVVLADPDADPKLVALDLLAQAEHGPGTLVVAISSSLALLADLATELIDAPDTGATGVVVEVPGVQDGLTLAQALAPEHLQLVGPTAEALARDVTRAGCVFVGASAGTAFGDYIAGSNHILPTNGAARFDSALSPATFRRRFTEVAIDDPGPLVEAAAPVARSEGFELHARSMEARIRDNH
jgi:histidinol dehydrogenase